MHILSIFAPSDTAYSSQKRHGRTNGRTNLSIEKPHIFKKEETKSILMIVFLHKLFSSSFKISCEKRWRKNNLRQNIEAKITVKTNSE